MMDNDETADDPNKPITPVFTQQPVGTTNKTGAGPDPLPGVTVRILQDNQEDAEFATRLLLEAFRGKMLTALGEEKYVLFTGLRVTDNRDLKGIYLSKVLTCMKTKMLFYKETDAFGHILYEQFIHLTYITLHPNIQI